MVSYHSAFQKARIDTTGLFLGWDWWTGSNSAAKISKHCNPTIQKSSNTHSHNGISNIYIYIYTIIFIYYNYIYNYIYILSFADDSLFLIMFDLCFHNKLPSRTSISGHPRTFSAGRFHPRASFGAPMESRARNRSQEVEVLRGSQWNLRGGPL